MKIYLPSVFHSSHEIIRTQRSWVLAFPVGRDKLSVPGFFLFVFRIQYRRPREKHLEDVSIEVTKKRDKKFFDRSM